MTDNKTIPRCKICKRRKLCHHLTGEDMRRKPRSPRVPDVRPCAECKRPTRKQGLKKKDFPDTIAWGGNGKCIVCYERERYGYAGKSGGMSRAEQAALALELRDLEAWEVEAARRVVRYDSEIMKLLGIGEEVSA